MTLAFISYYSSVWNETFTIVKYKIKLLNLTGNIDCFIDLIITNQEWKPHYFMTAWQKNSPQELLTIISKNNGTVIIVKIIFH